MFGSGSREGFGVMGRAGFEGPSPVVGAGVWGTSFETDGVTGTSTNVSGVFGVAGGLGPGLGPPAGVTGTSVARPGLYGTSANNVGCFGLSDASYGVFGGSSRSVGVYGNATRNAGVFGTSPVYGVWGRTNTGFGVNGEAAGAGIGVRGKAGAGGYAGYFAGPVYIQGYGVLGSASGPQASSAQPTSAQTVESFGTGKLSGGQAAVALDEDFAAEAQGSDYAVVVTEEGDSNGLYVTGKGPKGFTVKEKKGGTSGIPFSYRAVAKRKAPAHQAANGEAAPRIAMPKDVPVPTAPELPKPGESKPDRPGGPDPR